MKLLYKDVAKERGYNKLNRLHYELIKEQDCVFSPHIIHAYAEPNRCSDSKEAKWFNSLLENEKLFLMHSVDIQIRYTYRDKCNRELGDKRRGLKSIRNKIERLYDKYSQQIKFYAHGEDRNGEGGYEDILYVDMNTVTLEKVRNSGTKHPVVIHYHDYELKTIGSIRQFNSTSSDRREFLAFSSYELIEDFGKPFTYES